MKVTTQQGGSMKKLIVGAAVAASFVVPVVAATPVHASAAPASASAVTATGYRFGHHVTRRGKTVTAVTTTRTFQSCVNGRGRDAVMADSLIARRVWRSGSVTSCRPVMVASRGSFTVGYSYTMRGVEA